MDNEVTHDYSWMNLFDERQQKEINFCLVYAQSFAHGTDGHHAKMIIAKMADILNAVERQYPDIFLGIDKS